MSIPPLPWYLQYEFWFVVFILAGLVSVPLERLIRRSWKRAYNENG